MKIKTFFKTTILLLVAINISGCSDFLEEDFKSSLSPTNTFTSTYGFEIGTAGLYALARSEYNTYGEGGAYIHNGACPYEAMQVATDIVNIGNGDASLLAFANLTLTPEERFVASYWNWAYSMIASANEILIFSEQNTNWDSPDDKERFQAEARFFRAYAYRTLVYLYGDVPYVETILYDFQLDFTRTPKSEVLTHIVDDLTFATEHLPENPDSEGFKQGKLTKWAAHHLLSEMHLLQGDYAAAAASAQQVINSGYYQLMDTRFGVNASQPGDAFSDMFLENNQNRNTGNKESIWVLQFQFNTLGGGTNSDDWTRRAWNPKYQDISGFVLADTLGGRGLAQIVPMKWWVGTQNTNATGNNPGIFDDSDMRNSKYNIKREWYYNNANNTALYGQRANITDQTWTSTNTLFPALTKFFYGREENLSLTGSYKDRMKFRYAETYLLLAEAYIGMGDTQAAADAINAVRMRSGASQITAADVNIDFLLDERIRELVGEESRRFTLVRTNKLVDRVMQHNPALQNVIQPYHALWPIPQTIIDSNRDVEFPQNPGY